MAHLVEDAVHAVALQRHRHGVGVDAQIRPMGDIDERYHRVAAGGNRGRLRRHAVDGPA
jgi:hypothetical protein